MSTPFVLVISPSIAATLAEPPSPRARWKAEHHARRYERRYGRRPFVARGELGELQGVRIVCTITGAKP